MIYDVSSYPIHNQHFLCQFDLHQDPLKSARELLSRIVQEIVKLARFLFSLMLNYNNLLL